MEVWIKFDIENQIVYKLRASFINYYSTILLANSSGYIGIFYLKILNLLEIFKKIKYLIRLISI